MKSVREMVGLARALKAMVVTYLPGTVGEQIRRRYWASRLRQMGRDVRIDTGVLFVNPEYITLRDNCWLDKYVVVLAGPARRGERKFSRQPIAEFELDEGEVVIGRNCHIAHHVLINGHGGVIIGDDTGVAAGTCIFSLTHHYRNVDDREDTFLYRFGPRSPESEQALISAPVVVGENAALATNCTVLPGSTVGQNSWVAAASLVSGAIPAGVIAAGAPAKVIKPRPGAEQPEGSAEVSA